MLKKDFLESFDEPILATTPAHTYRPAMNMPMPCVNNSYPDETVRVKG